MKKILNSEQFGFCPGKQMSTASNSIIATFEYIKESKIEAQFLSVDIERAYDRVLNSVASEIIKFIFPEGNFAEGWTSLTKGGRFRAIVSNHCSQFYDLIVSILQGRPDAPSQFNILHKVFMACLESAKIREISLKINQEPVPCGGFADDTWKFLQMKNENDVKIIKTLLCNMEDSIGLKVNFKKTKILTFGTEPPGLSTLGKVCSNIKHLGIYIGFDVLRSAEMTYNELISKMEKKAKCFPMKFGFSILKRRNVCMAILNSMAYHIYRIYAPTAEQCSKLSKLVNKFIWSVEKNESISYRFKVASNRIESEFVQGGLNLLKSENQCFKIWLPSFINTLKHAMDYENSTLSLIFEYRKIPVENLLKNIGYHLFHKNMLKLKSIQSPINEFYLKKAENFFLDLEEDKKTFLYTPIASCSYFIKHDIEYFSEEEQACLNQKNIHTFVAILNYREINKDKVLVIPTLRDDIYDESFNLALIFKLEKLTEIVKKKFTLFDIMHCSKFKKMKKSLLQFNANILIGFHFKRIVKKSIDRYHPAIKTRKKDNIYFPDVETFEFSFKKLFSLPIMLNYKSLYYEQISRTLISKNKLSKFSKNEESNLCLKYVQTKFQI